jgi:C1A family cysteine protease
MSLYTYLKNWWNNAAEPRWKQLEHGGLGWQKDPLDARDKIYKQSLVDSGSIIPTIIPTSVDLRPLFPPVRSQGNLGSCTAFSLTGAFEYMLKKEGLLDFEPSELFLYYNERDMEGTVNSDSGAFIRDGIKSLNTLGVCDIAFWAYDTSKFTWKPNSGAYDNALKNKVIQYQRVFNTRPELIRLALSEGLPVVFGFNVYQSFMTIGTTGIMPMPAKDPTTGQITEKIVGGHAVCIVGYKQINGVNYYICRNSWSDWWGDKGYFYMPEDFIKDANMCSDFWAMNIIT